MSAGTLDQIITLQRSTATPDGGGGVTMSWASFATDANPWAKVKAKAGRESMIEGRTTSTFVVEFTIYNRADVTETDRILWQGVAYNIRGIRSEGERTLMLVIEADRGVNQ